MPGPANLTAPGKSDPHTESTDDLLFPRQEISPDQDAIIVPVRIGSRGYRYKRVSFRDLQQDIRRIAAGLRGIGAGPGMRIVLLVPFGRDFISLVFAIMRTGAQVVLIDPGMGLRATVRCLAEIEPDGFVAIASAHAVLWWYRHRFPARRLQVVVGGGWPGHPLRGLRQGPANDCEISHRHDDEPAAIIFTSGSTGPAKGVQFTRGNLLAQIQEIQRTCGIRPGGLDLACFPLFGLFNAVMGVTTVIADMNPARPASVDPRRLTRMIRDLKIDQSFASPAVWHRLGRYCQVQGVTLPSLRRAFAAGAPIATGLVRQVQSLIASDGQFITPYGATEALPIATIAGQEILTETAAGTASGAGICVGRRFDSVRWRIIGISDDPVETMDQAVELPPHEIGELIVAGPQVTTHYVTCTEANALHKIVDGDTIWHRMGDVGYLDGQERFWYCGRKSHRVRAPWGTMYSICCEAIVNEHPAIRRSALVGMGEPDRQVPVLVCQPLPECWPWRSVARQRLLAELAERAGGNPCTRRIRADHILLKRRLPLDTRHNAKIVREELIPWVTRRVRQ